MSLKEFTSRCRAIRLITASAFGIAQAADNAVTELVKAALYANHIGGLAVQAESGIVTLAGMVTGEQQRHKIVNIALDVQGVHGVYTGQLKTSLV